MDKPRSMNLRVPPEFACYKNEYYDERIARLEQENARLREALAAERAETIAEVLALLRSEEIEKREKVWAPDFADWVERKLRAGDGKT